MSRIQYRDPADRPVQVPPKARLAQAMAVKLPVVVRFQDGEGYRMGILIERGTKYFKLVMFDNPMRYRRVPLSDGAFMSIDLNYPVKRAAKIFRIAGSAKFQITKGAKRALRGL